MEKEIDVEFYQIDAHSIVHDNIDQVLRNNALFRLDAFSYTAGDCLFDAFQVLLHFRYSLTEMRNGLIDHFHKTTGTFCESYDLQADLPCPRATTIKKHINLGFKVTKHPFLIENEEYYRVR